MTIFNFTQEFPNENACIALFKAQREQKGVVCNKWHYWLRNKLSYECKRCHSRQSLRARTVLEHTKLPFRYRYVAMHLLTDTKKSFSSTELQRQLGRKRYLPIWELANKLRDVMGKRDSIYRLKDQTELDNAFITTLIPDDRKDEPLKRGAGSQKKSKVVVMTESTFVETPKKNKKSKRVNHIKMQIVNDMKADTITETVKKQVDSQAAITSDDSTSYKNLKQVVKSHDAQVVKTEDPPKILILLSATSNGYFWIRTTNRKKSIYSTTLMNSVTNSTDVISAKNFSTDSLWSPYSIQQICNPKFTIDRFADNHEI